MAEIEVISFRLTFFNDFFNDDWSYRYRSSGCPKFIKTLARNRL